MKLPGKISRCRGMTLLEVLLYMAVSLVVLACAFSVWSETAKHSHAISRNADDILAAIRAGERWRADVRASVGPPDVARSPEATVLRIRQKENVILYTFRERSVSRDVDGRSHVLLPRVAACSFAPDPRDHVTAWKWELELASLRKSTRVKPLFTFVAVPLLEGK